MIQGNDGGAVVSLDGGRTWSRRTISRPRRFTRSRSIISFRIASTARSRITSTVIVPSLALGNGQAYRTGPGCETGPIIPDKDNPQSFMAAAKGSSRG